MRPSPPALVRVLDAGTPLPADAGGMDFAERMSLWLNAFDAIRLQGVHQALRSATPPPARAIQRVAASALREDLQRVRSVMAKAIAQDPAPLASDAAAGYAVYQQRHADLQRQMAQMVGALREHVRQSLSRGSPRLRQLAALDAALEELLAGREQALLPVAMALLERRYLQGPEGAPETFEREWREALLAELELRLEPVAGLVEAAGAESH